LGKIFKTLFDKYDSYKESNLRSDFVSHSELKQQIEKLFSNKNFQVTQIGKSIEGRDIFSIKFGKGKRKILAWSQMHGDEPTATSALFDLINFFSANDEFNEFRNGILEELEIHFIPMLNPDGAEKYQRENAFNIDLNRDALKFQSDESKLLWDYSQKLKPEFGFNLHDQNSYYAAGRKNKTAAISFLAPPIDYSKSINYTREKAMQVISILNKALQEFIAENIARYSDDFEPRAFGDNFMKSGISTILIESGFYKNDLKKDFVRKLNFISILTALDSIAKELYKKEFYADYFEIPENTEIFFDLLLRNLTLNFNFRKFTVDVGINRTKKFNSINKEFYFEGIIAGFGDLSTFYGLEEFDLQEFELNFADNFKIDAPANFLIYKNDQPYYQVKDGFLTNLNGS